MIRKTLAMLALLSLTVGMLMAGCNPVTRARLMPPGTAGMVACAQEDGSGDAQAYPCVWDARVRGNRTYGDGYPPVLVYVRGTCPVLPTVARCFNVDEWTHRG